MTRQVEADLSVENEQSHVVNIGRLVEDMELKMRMLLQEVYFGKAKDVVGDLRSMLWSVIDICNLLTSVAGIPPLTETNRDKAAHRDIINSMNR